MKDETVHDIMYASQPSIQFRCDESWDTPAWQTPEIMALQTGLPEGVYLADEGRLYTFEAEKVTCPRCRGKS